MKEFCRVDDGDEVGNKGKKSVVEDIMYLNH